MPVFGQKSWEIEGIQAGLQLVRRHNPG